MELTPDAETAIAVITKLGGQPLLVGGCVRDHLLGIKSKDIDIEVHGAVSWLHLTELLADVGRVDLVGASFGVIKFSTGGTPVDISFPRRDSKVTPGHTGFMIDVDPTMTVKEALSRRDFTMNSIGFDVATGDFIDPFDGMADILKKRIRHTSDAFSEDPLRVMRAVQFASRFGFEIAADTAEICETLVDKFHELSIERIWVEWEKILTKGKSMEAVTRALRATGWWVHFPGWDKGISGHGVDEMLAGADRDRGREPRGIESQVRCGLILGAQFLRRTTALDHFLKAIDAPIWLSRSSLALATELTMPGTLAQQARQMARILDKQGVTLEQYLRVRNTKLGLWAEAQREQVMFEPDPPLLTGHDLQAFGLQPGPQFSVILAAALREQDWAGWWSKGEAFEWFKETYE